MTSPVQSIIPEIRALLSSLYGTRMVKLFMQEERYLHENSPLLLNIRREGLVL